MQHNIRNQGGFANYWKTPKIFFVSQYETGALPNPADWHDGKVVDVITRNNKTEAVKYIIHVPLLLLSAMSKLEGLFREEETIYFSVCLLNIVSAMTKLEGLI